MSAEGDLEGAGAAQLCRRTSMTRSMHPREYASLHLGQKREKIKKKSMHFREYASLLLGTEKTIQTPAATSAPECVVPCLF